MIFLAWLKINIGDETASSYNNSNNIEKLNDIILNEINLSDVSGAVIYHLYSSVPNTLISLTNTLFANSIEGADSSSVWSGTSMIILKEDGTGCGELLSDLSDLSNWTNSFEDTIDTMLQLLIQNSWFSGNRYNDCIIDSCCGIMQLENVEFKDNIGVLSSRLHIDASRVLIGNSIFKNNSGIENGDIYNENLDNNVGDGSGIYIINSSFENNAVTSGSGACITIGYDYDDLYDDDNSTLDIMTTLADVVGPQFQIIDCNFTSNTAGIGGGAISIDIVTLDE